MNGTIGFEIDKVRHLIRQTSDDTSFSDEMIYSMLLDNRNILIYRELSKDKFRSKFLFKTVCMPLEKAKDIPCDCIPSRLGCTVLKSKFKIPKPVRSPIAEIITITTIDGRTQFSYKEVRVGKYNKYSRVHLEAAPYYTIYNEYLYIIGYPGNSLPAILLSMVPEDPSAFDNINLCTPDTITEETCFNPLVDSFNIDGYLIGAMIDMTLERLGITLKLPEAVSNDANAVPKEQQH